MEASSFDKNIRVQLELNVCRRLTISQFLVAKLRSLFELSKEFARAWQIGFGIDLSPKLAGLSDRESLLGGSQRSMRDIAKVRLTCKYLALNEKTNIV